MITIRNELAGRTCRAALTLFMMLATGCAPVCHSPDPIPASKPASESAINRSPPQRLTMVEGILTLDRCLDVAPVRNKAERELGKITSIFWVEGEQRLPVLDITHVGDAGLIINTQGYQPGSCIEAILGAEDEYDLIDGYRQLRLWGKVDSRGEVVLRYIFNDLPSPLIISAGDESSSFLGERMTPVQVSIDRTRERAVQPKHHPKSLSQKELSDKK